MHNGWSEALRGLGEHVIEYNLDRRITFYDQVLMADDLSDEEGRQAIHKALTREQAIELAANGVLSACYQTWPDVVLFVSAFFTPAWMLEVIRARRHTMVMLFTETPYQTDQQLEMAKYADYCLLNDPAGIEQYEALCPSVYMPHAYRPHIHYPAPAGTQKIWDLAFAGSGFPSRMAFFAAMDLSGLDVRLAGPWLGVPDDHPLRDWTDPNPEGCLDNDEVAEMYRQARCGINIYRREAEDAHLGEGWAMGPREVEMAATQLFFVRDPRPEGDELFPMLPTFTSPEQAGDLIRWYAAHDGDRERRAAAAREAVAERTFENNAKALLRMIQKG